MDSGRRPQRSHAKNCDHTIRVLDFRTPGLRLCLDLKQDIYMCEQDGRDRSHGRRHLHLPAAVGRAAASMRTESPSWRLGDMTAPCPLPLAGQQTSTASGPATRARDEHACCRSIPRFSVRAQEAGPRRSAVKSNVACSRDFLVSQSLASWHRASSAQSAVALNTNLVHWIDA